MKRLMVLILAVFLMSPAAGAVEVAKVTLPDSLTAGDDTLMLNGAGLRKKFVIKVYAAGLYLKEKASDPAKIIDEDAPMAIRMHFIHDGVSSKKLVDAWNKGFMDGTGGNVAPIQTGIDQFNAFFTEEARKDDIYDIIYVPEQGVSVYIKGALKGVVKGLDFKKALFSIWLGDKPADAKLKKGMLGQ